MPDQGWQCLWGPAGRPRLFGWYPIYPSYTSWFWNPNYYFSSHTNSIFLRASGNAACNRISEERIRKMLSKYELHFYSSKCILLYIVMLIWNVYLNYNGESLGTPWNFENSKKIQNQEWIIWDYILRNTNQQSIE